MNQAEAEEAVEMELWIQHQMEQEEIDKHDLKIFHQMKQEGSLIN
jgi:hypothetical protein